MASDGKLGEVQTDETQWLSVNEAARAIGISPWCVRRLGRLRKITTLEIPGCKVRFRRADVERLAAEAVRPAEAMAG